MIIKLTNKDENFYKYMGKFFGSRIVESQTNDRIYDDSNKEWYIYLNDETAVGFISVSKDVIKNIYAIKAEYIVELLKSVQEDIIIKPSIITKTYEDAYITANLKVNNNLNYKNFVIVSSTLEINKAKIS